MGELESKVSTLRGHLNSARIALGVAILALGGNLVRLELARSAAPIQGAVVAHQVVLEETLYHKTGPGRGGTYTYAVRGDGATATRSISRQARAVAVQRTIVLPSGQRITLDDVRELKSTTFDPMRRPLLKDAAKDCTMSLQGAPISDGVKVGRDIVLGRQVVELRSAGIVKWLALDAGCALVRLRRGSKDEPNGVQEANLIRVGEPDPELFFVPDRYREVRPSELLQVSADGEYGKRIDSYYEKHRQPSR